MFFIPTVAYYLAVQDAYQKCLSMSAIAVNAAIAATTLTAVLPVLLSPKQ